MKKIAWHRVWAVILWHMYNFYHTWDRIVDAFYWPSLDIIVWGLTISSLQKQGTGTAFQIAMILVGVVLWYVLWRGQYEITVNLLEELWAENFADALSLSLLVRRLPLPEWTIALCAIGFLKLSMTVTFTAGLAYLLYAVDVFRLGFTLIPFIIGLLIMGWGFGLLIAVLFLLNYGTTSETLAWAGGFLLMPFSAVDHPIASLPAWMRAVSQFLPSSYIFEGMRMVLSTGTVPTEMLVKSYVLNVVFLGLSLLFFCPLICVCTSQRSRTFEITDGLIKQNLCR